MKLDAIYFELKKLIDEVDFSLLWDGFTSLKFAVYTDEECFFDGQYIEKTGSFIANTAILHNGEYISIWNIQELDDIEVLASKMIHEMFHGFQMANNEDRFPNELDALMKYRYSSENLSIKLEENILINTLLENFDSVDYQKLLALRKYRLMHFPYEYKYESAIEQIEGTAAYVELNALKQISPEKYAQTLDSIRSKLAQSENFFPIRVVSYTIGALFLEIMKRHDLFHFESFSDEPATQSVLGEVTEYKGELPHYLRIDEKISDYNAVTERIIEQALSFNDCVLDGEYELLGVNVYNARYYNRYIISTYFVAYQQDGKESYLYGDFVIEMNAENKISKVYKIPETQA